MSMLFNVTEIDIVKNEFSMNIYHFYLFENDTFSCFKNTLFFKLFKINISRKKILTSETYSLQKYLSCNIRNTYFAD